jgi:hypothetical protein
MCERAGGLHLNCFGSCHINQVHCLSVCLAQEHPWNTKLVLYYSWLRAYDFVATSYKNCSYLSYKKWRQKLTCYKYAFPLFDPWTLRVPKKVTGRDVKHTIHQTIGHYICCHWTPQFPFIGQHFLSKWTLHFHVPSFLNITQNCQHCCSLKHLRSAVIY